MAPTSTRLGNSRTPAVDPLAEGLRYEKAGLLDKALSQYRDVRRGTEDPVLRARSWTLESYVHHARGLWQEALEAAERGAALAREAGRPDTEAEALNARATVHYSRGSFGEAQRLFEEMLALSEDARVRGLALQNLGSLHGQLGDLERSEACFADAERHFADAGYEWGRAHVHNNRAALALEREDWIAARAASGDAIHVARRMDDLDLLAIATMNLAEALVGLGQLDEAETELSRALGQFELSGNTWRRVACLRILGDLSARRGDETLARRMWQRGLDLARRIGAEADIELLVMRLSKDDVMPPETERDG